MTRLTIGPATLLLPDQGGRQRTVTDFRGEPHEGWETPAVVAGGESILLEIAYQRWDHGGAVIALSRGDSAPAFDRLLHGERLSVIPSWNGTEHVVADLLHWDPAKGGTGWGNCRKATPQQLDSTLGDSAESLFFEAGALDFGTRAELLGDTSNGHKNRLAVVYPERRPLGALTVYVLTRVLPIARSRVAS